MGELRRARPSGRAEIAKGRFVLLPDPANNTWSAGTHSSKTTAPRRTPRGKAPAARMPAAARILRKGSSPHSSRAHREKIVPHG